MPRRQPHEEQRDDHREERGRIQREGERVAAQRDDHSREGRPHHATEVELGRRERDGGEQVVLGDEVGQHRLVGGDADRGHAPAEEHQHRDPAGPGHVQADQERQQRGEDRLAHGREQHPPAPVDAVGHGPTHGRDKADGYKGGRGHEARPFGLVGDVGDEDPDRDRLHPRPDVRHEGRTPHEREVPLVQGPQRGIGHDPASV